MFYLLLIHVFLFIFSICFILLCFCAEPQLKSQHLGAYHPPVFDASLIYGEVTYSFFFLSFFSDTCYDHFQQFVPIFVSGLICF